MGKIEFREWNVHDLKEFGIGYLTGEACNISLRGLYDLTPEGVGHIESFFSIVLADNSPNNWNSSVGKMPAIKSIKLSPEQARDLLIGILASYLEVVVEFTPRQDKKRQGIKLNRILMGGTELGYKEYTLLIKHDPFIHDNYGLRFYKRTSQETQPHHGLDNVHAFSRRTT